MKNFIKGSSVLAFGDLITKLMSILYLIPLNNIDPQIPALMSYLLIPFAFAMVFSTLGINVILNTEFAKYYQKDSDKLKQALVVGTVILGVFSFITLIVMVGGARFMMTEIVGADYFALPALIDGTKILALGVFLYSLAVFLRSLLTAFGEYTIISISYVTEQFLKVGLILVFAQLMIVNQGAPLESIVYIVAISIVASMATTPLLYIWKMKKEGYFKIFKEGKYERDFKVYKNILVASVVFFASSIYISAFDQIDLFLFHDLMKGAGYAGKDLDLAQSEYFFLSIKFVMIPIQLSAAFVSVMVREIQVANESKGEDFNKILTIVTVYSIVMMVGIWFVGPHAYKIMYGEPVYNVIAFQGMIIPFYIIRNVISGYVVTNDGKLWSILTSAAVILISKTVLDVVFFKMFDAMGMEGMIGLSLSSVVAITLSILILVIPNHDMFAKSKAIFVEKSMLVVKGIVLFAVSYLFTNFMNGFTSRNLALILIESLFILGLSIILYMWDIKNLKNVDNK